MGTRWRDLHKTKRESTRTPVRIVCISTSLLTDNRMSCWIWIKLKKGTFTIAYYCNISMFRLNSNPKVHAYREKRKKTGWRDRPWSLKLEARGGQVIRTLSSCLVVHVCLSRARGSSSTWCLLCKKKRTMAASQHVEERYSTPYPNCMAKTLPHSPPSPTNNKEGPFFRRFSHMFWNGM